MRSPEHLEKQNAIAERKGETAGAWPLFEILGDKTKEPMKIVTRFL